MIRNLRSASLFTTLAVVLIAALVSVDLLWQGRDGQGWKETIRSDAKGYYGYLVAVFIRGDLGNEPYAWEYIHRTPTGTLNKYFCGTSLMMAPWFLIGHDLALGDPKVPHDGFSRYEMQAISVGGWVYLLLGLLALRALLLGMGTRDAVVTWILAGLGLGTPLLQYAAVQPGWSHVYSFCCISLFLLVVHRLGKGASLRWMVPATLLLAIIVLIRPVNGLVLLATPVVLGQGTVPFIRRLLARPGALVPAVLVGALAVSVQPFLWHAQTGNWFEWGYRNEGFHWNRPEVFEVLFGFRRGLFLWTPLMLLHALSAILLWRSDRMRGGWVLLYWLANTYIISAWWIWYYGSGFGSRVFIDHYPVLVIPCALVATTWKARAWLAARLFMAVCILLHLAQFAQYHLQVLHVEHMDRRKYAWTFLRFGEAHRDKLGGSNEAAPYHPNGLEPMLVAATDLERHHPHWHGGRILRHPRAFSGAMVCQYDDSTEFGSTFIADTGTLPMGRELFLDVVVMRYEERAGDSFPAVGIASVQRTDGSFAFYKSFRMNDLPGQEDDHWERLHYTVPIPALEPGDQLRFYLWNQELKSRFLIDDPIVRVWAVRPY